MASIIGVTINRVPVAVFGELNQYVECGPGTLDFSKPGRWSLTSLGDQFCTTTDHIAGQQLQFRLSNPADAGLTFRIFGEDVNGQDIYDTNGSPGQNLTTVNPVATFPTALNTFNGLQKPATKGSVSVYSWNGSVATLLSVYEPWETRPHYSRYGTGTYDSTKPIGCLCRKRYYPLVSDTDFCDPGNINGLQAAIQAIDCSQSRNFDEAKMAWGECYRVLNDEVRSLRGKAQPSVQVIGPMSQKWRVSTN